MNQSQYNTILTEYFSKYVASKTILGEKVKLTEFLFLNLSNAMLSGLTAVSEIQSMQQYVVHRQKVSKAGLVNQDSVAYSVTMGTDVGDFTFNAIALLTDEEQVAIFVKTASTDKIKNKDGVQGNSITRNILLEFVGAAEQTQINVSAETWQIDFTARLNGLDDDIRKTNLDIYGDVRFFDDGFLVIKKSQNIVNIKSGVGYIKGYRVEQKEDHILVISEPNSAIYMDIVREGAVTSKYNTSYQFTTVRTEDYVDIAGNQHYIIKLCDIDENWNVIDRRNVGSVITEYQLSAADGYKYIGRCKSIAELRTIRPTEHGQRILVDAYYEGGTTGGGEFVADLQDLDTPDDGGVCFVVEGNGGRWKRLFTSSLQDTDFGVIGDGVADDTIKLNAFLDSLRRYKVKGYFTSRHYKTSATLNIAGVDIEGVLAGYKNKQGTRITGSGNHNIFEQVGVELQHITYSIKNFALSNGLVGLKMNYAVNSTINNVFIDDVDRAFLLGDARWVGPIWCNFKNCRGEGRISGIEIDGDKWSNANIFDTCFFKGDDFAGKIDTQGGIGAVSNHFINTEFAGRGFGVKLLKNKSTSFDNCYFECEGPALLVESATSDLALNDATFGSLTEDNKTGKTAFIHHIAGSCNLVVNSGYIYLSGRNQNNLTFIESERPESFVLNMPTPVKREIYTATGFKLFRNPGLPNKISRIQYTSSYACEFTSANQNAELGNGELVAYYSLNNSRCTVTLNLKIGSSTTKGTGQWQFRLPFQASSIAKYHLGQAVALKADGSLLKVGVARIVGSSNHVVVYFDNINAADATRPFEWVEGDKLDISIEYEI